MEASELLRSRHSASKLGTPAPSAEAVEAMLVAAARAPDHGRLQPWRPVVQELAPCWAGDGHKSAIR
jgi:nitroreductase